MRGTIWEKSTDCCGAVIHPQRLLHVGAQQDLSITEGATVQVQHEANSSALMEVPLKLVWRDFSTFCSDREQDTKQSTKGLML